MADTQIPLELPAGTFYTVTVSDALGLAGGKPAYLSHVLFDPRRTRREVSVSHNASGGRNHLARRAI